LGIIFSQVTIFVCTHEKIYICLIFIRLRSAHTHSTLYVLPCLVSIKAHRNTYFRALCRSEHTQTQDSEQKQHGLMLLGEETYKYKLFFVRLVYNFVLTFMF